MYICNHLNSADPKVGHMIITIASQSRPDPEGVEYFALLLCDQPIYFPFTVCMINDYIFDLTRLIIGGKCIAGEQFVSQH
jgi:hypothetical protein